MFCLRDLLFFTSGVTTTITLYFTNKYVLTPLWKCYTKLDKKIENKYKDL